MPLGLKRYQQNGDLHFVTFSCYRRLPYLKSPEARDIFEQTLEATRKRYDFWINAYVVMPEHVHLLVSEPKEVDLATALGVLKQESGKKLKPKNSDRFWTTRYYDFNIYSERKRLEKIRYIHRNPVLRGLAGQPEAWPWSSYRHYDTGQQYTVRIESTTPNANPSHSLRILIQKSKTDWDLQGRYYRHEPRAEGGCPIPRAFARGGPSTHSVDRLCPLAFGR